MKTLEEKRAYARAATQRYRDRNRERLLVIGRTYRAANRELLVARTKAKQQDTRKWIQEIKLQSGCVDCGFKAHPAALHFDHVRGTKLFTIGSKPHKVRETVLAEIAKCEIRCANCHAIVTDERRKHAS